MGRLTKVIDKQNGYIEFSNKWIEISKDRNKQIGGCWDVFLQFCHWNYVENTKVHSNLLGRDVFVG